MKMQKLIEAVGKKFGVIIVPDWRAVRLVEERHLTRIFREFDVDCVFDVGGNIGQYGRMLREHVGYGGQIIFFEPHPSIVGKLRDAAALDGRWHVESFALGGVAGKAAFHAYDMSELGSLRRFSSSFHAPQVLADPIVTVDVRTLELYFLTAKSRWGFTRPFLKIDTQGFDLEVAKGAGLVLREFVGIQSEIAFQNIYQEAPTYCESMRFFQNMGFVASRIFPTHEIHFPELVEMDFVAIRDDLIKFKGN